MWLTGKCDGQKSINMIIYPGIVEILESSLEKIPYQRIFIINVK